MATSTNYGWAEPDNSSLVKNGASDIRTLGNAIDTSVWNVGYGQAGKNKFINGDFSVNQRGFTSTTTNDVYTFDRWRTSLASLGTGVATYSAQTFTAGTAPVAGYEGTNFFRIATSGFVAGGTTSSGVHFDQRIEDVRTFANQPVSVSFWAKANSGTPNVAVRLQQSFGSGGSSSVFALFGSVTAISTSWVRYTFTGTVPSISGKTLGAGSYLTFRLYVVAGSAVSDVGGVGLQDNTFDFWGVQAEYGSKATPFQTATGTIQGELAACQRYYWRNTADQGYTSFANGMAFSTTATVAQFQLPVQMRIAPSALEYSGVQVSDYTAQFVPTSLSINQNSKMSPLVQASGLTGLTQFRPYCINAGNSTSTYIAFTAELQEITMDKVTFITDEQGNEHAIIDRGNGEFTSMLKATYEAQQVEHLTEIPTPSEA